MTEQDVFEARFAAAYRQFLSEAPTEVDAVAVARAAAAAHPRVRWPALLSLGSLRPVAWILLLAALLLGLVASLYIGWHQRTDNSFVPTGIDVLTSEGGASYWPLAVDGQGVLWATQSGDRLVRVNPRDAEVQKWTVSDDAAFAAPTITGAHAGGVWLVTDRDIRRFDGEAFRETIDLPPGPGNPFQLVAEGGDRIFWGATGRSVFRWDGNSWAELGPDGRSANPGVIASASIDALAADVAGGVWIHTTTGSDGSGEVLYYDAAVWHRFGANDCAPLAGGDASIDILPNGDVWVSTTTGLARWDGTSWKQVREADPSRAAPLGVAAGVTGEVVLVEANYASAPASATWQLVTSRLDDQSYALREARSWGPLDWSLPVSGPVESPDGVFMTLGGQLLRLDNNRWVKVVPDEESIVTPPTAFPPNGPLILAVSHDETWVGGESTWHFVDGEWREEPILIGGSVDKPVAMDLAADGTVWVAGRSGTAYYRDGQWTVVDDKPASAIALDSDGTPWLGDGGAFGNGCVIWTLRDQGGTWQRQDIAGCPLGMISMSLALDTNGDIWIGGGGYVTVGLASRGVPGQLARFDGQAWTRVDEVNDVPIESSSVTSAPHGDAVLMTIDHVFPDSYYASPETYPEPFDAYLFDGASWIPVAMPPDRSILGGQPLMAPDGTVWAWSVNGPARYDGAAWQFPYADVPATALPPWGPYSVARDGTMFSITGTDVIRLPTP